MGGAQGGQGRTKSQAPPPEGGGRGADRKFFLLHPPVRSSLRLRRPLERGRAPEVKEAMLMGDPERGTGRGANPEER